jgi:hypothetical protein
MDGEAESPLPGVGREGAQDYSALGTINPSGNVRLLGVNRMSADRRARVYARPSRLDSSAIVSLHSSYSDPPSRLDSLRYRSQSTARAWPSPPSREMSRAGGGGPTRGG